MATNEDKTQKADDAIYDAVIVGGGPAGLTAAIYLARARARVLVVERDEFGGQINITEEVVNYPGVLTASGRELTRTMQRQAEGFGAEFLLAEVSELGLEGDVKRVVTSRGTFEALSVLLATGAHPRMVGFEGEAELKGHGVAYCATCDGEFFSGREVFVVGGGFAAAEESVFLTKYARHVTVLVREDDFTCAPATAEATKAHPKIDVRYGTEVVSVAGDGFASSIRWRDRATGKEEEYSDPAGIGVFVFAGYEPATDLVRGVADIDPAGYVLTDAHQRTTAQGVFAAGDVCVKPLRQVATAVGQAATTATEMERYIKDAQERTGRAGVQPATRIQPQLKAESQAKASAQAQPGSGSPFDDDTRAQLETVLSRMASPVALRLHLDASPAAQELRAYAEGIAGLSDKASVELAPVEGEAAEELPYVEVCRADGMPSGLEFHGVPGGHEFTSFVLGLYNVAGPGQPIADEDRAAISGIDEPYDIRVIVGLSCTMCPETVTSAQRIAAESPRVAARVYDVALHPELRERYDVMSVPCVVVGRADGSEEVSFGKKGLSQMLELLSA
jgi:thioredoxin reductase (NADPH)